MLDTTGKFLKKLIKLRLMAMKDAEDLLPKQYGFRTGLSIMDVNLEVMLI